MMEGGLGVLLQELERYMVSLHDFFSPEKKKKQKTVVVCIAWVANLLF